MQPATLCFIRDNDKILLIRKKRGVGEGLFNGPGGKVEEGEAVDEAAVREVEEEIGVTPLNVEKRGETRFVFGDDPFMHVHIFVATDYDGEPEETGEAEPHWFHVDELPYDDMWPDDRYWMPHFLAHNTFRGTFWFDDDGDELLDHKLETDPQLPARTSWSGR